MQRATIISNPFAGTARGRLGVSTAEHLLSDAGWDVAARSTESSGHATTLAAEAAANSDLVVAVGGDGTVHEVARGLLGTQCPMAVLPSGSGNDFAQGIGCPTVAAAMAAIATGSDKSVDICSMDDKLFLNSVGLAASGKISGRAAKLWRFLGRGRYILASIPVLLTYRGQQISWEFAAADDALAPGGVVAQSSQAGRYMLAEICNGPSTGGGFRFSPDADPGDQLMDICLVRPVSAITGLKLLPAAASGKKLEHEAISRIRANSLEFTTDEPVAWHRDGEPGVLPAGKHQVKVLAEKLLVRVPSNGVNTSLPQEN